MDTEDLKHRCWFCRAEATKALDGLNVCGWHYQRMTTEDRPMHRPGRGSVSNRYRWRLNHARLLGTHLRALTAV